MMVRDLKTYPITTHEVLTCLEDLGKDLSYERTGLVGDLRPTLLEKAAEIVSRHTDLARLCPRDHLQRLVTFTASRCARSLNGYCHFEPCEARARARDPEASQGECPDFELVVVLLNVICHLRCADELGSLINSARGA